MKNKFMLRSFAFFFLMSSNLLAQNFWVPDAGLRGVLKWWHPSCFTANDSLIINCSGIVNDTSVNLQHKNIYNLDGIQFFSKPENIRCNR